MRRIPVPNWAPDHARGQFELDGVSHQEYGSLQKRRPEILAALDAAVDRYVKENSEPGDDSFPSRDRLTGEFYIGHETYSKQSSPASKKNSPASFQISLFCRCLEQPRPGSDEPDDYLGLEVYVRCEPDGPCSALDIDSSVI